MAFNKIKITTSQNLLFGDMRSQDDTKMICCFSDRGLQTQHDSRMKAAG